MFSTTGAGAIARALRANKSLQFVDLSRNNLRAEGVTAIAAAIAPRSNPEVSLLAMWCWIEVRP